MGCHLRFASALAHEPDLHEFSAFFNHGFVFDVVLCTVGFSLII
jgi:hypothetical protein